MQSEPSAADTPADMPADHDGHEIDEAEPTSSEPTTTEKPRQSRYCAIVYDPASQSHVKIETKYKQEMIDKLRGIGSKRLIDLYYGRSFQPQTRVDF